MQTIAFLPLSGVHNTSQEVNPNALSKTQNRRFLSEWKANPDKKPLIVKGPRQVGKTESIQRFASENYTSVITINFVEEPKYKMITADGYKAADIIKNISRIDPSKRFIEGETLIFFDELQEFPDIATALKFFKIDGRFDVICSGFHARH